MEREHSDAANFATKKYYENLGYEVEDAGRQFIARIPWQKHQDYLKKVQDPYLKMLNPNPYEGKDPDGFKYSIEQDGGFFGPYERRNNRLTLTSWGGKWRLFA